MAMKFVFISKQQEGIRGQSGAITSTPDFWHVDAYRTEVFGVLKCLYLSLSMPKMGIRDFHILSMPLRPGADFERQKGRHSISALPA